MRVSAGIRASDGGRAEVGARHRRQALVGAGDGQRGYKAWFTAYHGIRNQLLGILCSYYAIPYDYCVVR